MYKVFYKKYTKHHCIYNSLIHISLKLNTKEKTRTRHYNNHRGTITDERTVPHRGQVTVGSQPRPQFPETSDSKNNNDGVYFTNEEPKTIHSGIISIVTDEEPKA